MKTIPVSQTDLEFLEAHVNPSGVVLEERFCKYCGDSEFETAFQVDHIIPLSKGGEDVPENKQEICWRCNLAKLNMPEKELINWINRIKKRAE